MQRTIIDQRTNFKHYHTWISVKRDADHISWRCTAGYCDATRVTDVPKELPY